MLTLGHIHYSNCLPVHAQVLAEGIAGVRVVQGTPGELNRALAHGDIDVAPCSSIEYARQPERYRLLPGLVIGSQGRVRSIRLESTRPLEALSDCTVAVPTASATSVVLLRILLEQRYGSQARLVWYEQEAGTDPITQGAAAALWIGDQALTRAARRDRNAFDLGALWTEWTALPFAFALWQTRLGAERDVELQELAAQLQAARDASLADPLRLAERHAAGFGLSPASLADYWTGLRYTLDEPMLHGLTRFYEGALALGEIASLPALRWLAA